MALLHYMCGISIQKDKWLHQVIAEANKEVQKAVAVTQCKPHCPYKMYSLTLDTEIHT